MEEVRKSVLVGRSQFFLAEPKKQTDSSWFHLSATLKGLKGFCEETKCTWRLGTDPIQHVAVALRAALCPPGSCFQMTPGGELSASICISLARTPPTPRAPTYECGGLFSAWLGVCHKYFGSGSHTHTISDTNRRRWTDRCKCV